MEQLCTGCLCAGRKLYFIGETGFSELYTQILNEIPVSGMSSVHVRLCWECVARLRRFHLFKIQVKQCYTEMLWHIPPPPLPPRLSTHPQPPISYPEDFVLKHEVDVKSEDEHWEPETFVNDLSVVEEEGREDREETGEAEEKGEEEERGEKQERREEEKKITKKSKKKTKTKEKKEKIKKTKTRSKTKLKTKKTKQPIESNETELLVEEMRIEENGIEEKRMEAEEGRVLEVKVSIEKVEDKSENEESVSRGSVLPDKPQCVECGKMFSSRKTYRYHLNVLHRGQNRYPCPRCGKVYQWKSNLGRHLRTHKAVDLGELHCALCDKTFASVATYRQHLRISRRHVTENDYSFTCDECGKKFVSKTRLRDHIDWEHLNNIKFRCHLCNKAYKCHTSLYVHLQNVHRNKEKKDNLCHVCGKSYQNPAKLKYHITALHTGETPYQCVQCSAAFGWYSSLYRHVREVHYKMKVQPKKSKKLKKIENEPPTYPHYQT